MYKDTLAFLTQLKKNNTKEWFDKNRGKYEEVRTHFIEVVDSLLLYLEGIDETIGGQEGRKCVFRINRDIRFAKDKSPYKLHFSAYFCKNGKKSAGPGYYIHLQPGNESVVGGGVYNPEAPLLAKIRQEVDYNGAELKKILNKASFRKLFPHLEGEQTSRVPKGYSEDNDHIDYIRYKSFFVMQTISDADIVNGNFEKICKKAFKELKPFNDFLGNALE